MLYTRTERRDATLPGTVGGRDEQRVGLLLAHGVAPDAAEHDSRTVRRVVGLDIEGRRRWAEQLARVASGGVHHPKRDEERLVLTLGDEPVEHDRVTVGRVVSSLGDPGQVGELLEVRPVGIDPPYLLV